MLAISFGWTWHAVVMGVKPVTNRAWKDSHAKKFTKGRHCAALDKGYHAKGRQFGVIEVVNCYPFNTADMPDEDYKREGFEFYDQHPYLIPPASPFAKFESMEDAFNDWREQSVDLYRLEFKNINVEAWAVYEVEQTIIRNGGTP